MSLTNLTKILTSLVLVLALTTQVFAYQGFRPWAPYQRDQFGGGARRAEGVYGTLEGVYYTFAPSKNIVVGDTSSATGGIRQVYNGHVTFTQTNTISSNNLGALSGMGTRAEVGNNVGHHGWSIGGYSLRDMSSTIDSPNASMVINDRPAPLDVYSIGGEIFGMPMSDLWFYFVWDPSAPGGFNEVSVNHYPPGLVGHGDMHKSTTYYPSALWGWFPSRWNYAGDEIWIGQLAPLPLTFERTTVTTKIDHWVIDAVYTYRCHPTRLGNLDLFGGVRYMEIDDSLLFLGEGHPWRGVVVDDDNPDIFSGDALNYGSILGNSDWRFKADNHIIAPQIGGRLSRTLGRWTLSGEGKFMAGFNQQNLRSSGTVGSHYNNMNDGITFPDIGTGTVTDLNLYPWSPLGIASGSRSFNHSKTHHEFSPGVEVKVNANWQLTNAVGINFGVTGMWVDEIARGHKINDYTIYNDQIFALRNNGFTDSALMYGVNFGVTVNRF